jgi:hypothetical protein
MGWKTGRHDGRYRVRSCGKWGMAERSERFTRYDDSRPCVIPRPIPLAASHSLVTRQRVGRKRAPLRRPSGTRDESAHSRARVEGTSLFPGPGFSIQENPPGLVGLVSAPQKGFKIKELEKQFFLFPLSSSTSSTPVWRAQASQALLPCDRRRSSGTTTVVRQDRKPCRTSAEQ